MRPAGSKETKVTLLERYWHHAKVLIPTIPASFAMLHIILEIYNCISVVPKIIPIQAYFKIAIIFGKSGWCRIFKDPSRDDFKEEQRTSYQLLSSIFRTSRRYFLRAFVPHGIASRMTVTMLQEDKNKPGWSLAYRSNPPNAEVQEGSLK